jgi:F like protein
MTKPTLADETTFAGHIFQALTTWLAKVRAAVMAAWNKHKALPNPVAVQSTQPLWLQLLAAIEKDLKSGAIQGAQPLDEHLVEQSLAASHRLLARIPDEVQDLISSEIKTAVSQGDAPDAIARRIDLLLSATGSERWKNRAQVIAVTELHRMANAVTQAAALKLQSSTNSPLTKTWVSQDDSRVRPTHQVADAQTVPLTGAFRVGDSLMLYPGDPAAPADEVVNCRCSMKINDGSDA